MRKTNSTQLVPLYRPGMGTKQVTAAHLTYEGGPLLTNVQVFTIFWGKFWTDIVQKDLANRLNAFFDTILTSSLMTQMAEYNHGTLKIGNGKRIGTLIYTASAPKAQTTDQEIQDFIQKLIKAKTIPASTPNTLYFIYTPSKVVVEQGGQESCSVFCGYHETINDKIFYAVMPYPDCSGCLGGLPVFSALTSVSSHELCEAITDPIPGQGWYDAQHGEIGDICAWKVKQVGKYTVQQEWSNKNKKCM